MSRRPASKTRDDLDASVRWVTRRRQMIVYRKGNKPVAALVPIKDVALIEALEDEIDVRAARRALKEPGSTPWEQVKKDLGLS